MHRKSSSEEKNAEIEQILPNFDLNKKANWIADIWNRLQDVPALEAKINSGIYSGSDMAAYQLLKGENRILAKFIDKLIPDLLDVTSKGESLRFISNEEVLARIQRLK